MIITYEIAMAAGRDAGNHHARRNGRAAWSREDRNHAADVTNRLMGLSA